MQQLQSGSKLQKGKYEIISVLGQGGFGITYLAHQTILNRKVAIKEFFYKELCNRSDTNSTVTIISKGGEETVLKFLSKFLKEARTIASLKHQNIIEVYDVFEENGTAYYVMEYVEGKTLSEIIKEQGKLDETTAILYIKKVASALSYIHQHNINHLDIKPGNIMLRDKDNEVIVIDFGMAKHYDVKTGDGTTTTPIGISPGYAPLEQYRQGGVSSFTPESDIYSLGATLYKLVTGNNPPEASQLLEDGELEGLGNIGQNVSKTIKQAMQTSKSKRPHSVKDFLALLCGKDETNKSHSSDKEIDNRPDYSDFDWPEDNTGWFVGTTSLSGRWRRREFLVGFLIVIIVSFFIVSWWIAVIFGAISTKRLKDMNCSPYWGFVPAGAYLIYWGSCIINTFGSLTYFSLVAFLGIGCTLCLYPGSKGINEYGSNPRRGYEEQCLEAGFPKLSDCK